MTAFGKFPSLDAFLVGYETEAGRPPGGMPLRSTYRDVVEVDCRIAEVEPADTHGLKHIRLHVALTAILSSARDVLDDVRDHLASHACVLVAIQYGGRGMPEPIPGLIQGADVRLRGRWIPAERARQMGGDKLSVLHFTHAPVGFVMIGGTVYR